MGYLLAAIFVLFSIGIYLFDKIIRSHLTIKPGDYVIVAEVPVSWEGSGEPPEARYSLLGHVGLVTEVVEEEGVAFVLFLFTQTNQPDDGIICRNIELVALQPIEPSPARPIDQWYWENL